MSKPYCEHFGSGGSVIIGQISLWFKVWKNYCIFSSVCVFACRVLRLKLHLLLGFCFSHPEREARWPHLTAGQAVSSASCFDKI